jgi:hypothetical protein
LNRQSFAGFVSQRLPEHVREKLTRWGVADHVVIFSRAIGLNALFAKPPVLDAISEDALRNYHRYADALYQAFMDSEPHPAIGPANFKFDLYASGEYSRMLESQWDN